LPSPRIDANAVLDDLRIQAPEDLRDLADIAWARGVLVRDGSLVGAEARLAVVGRRGIITISSSLKHPQRRRFAIAHELGHFEMHRNASALAVCTSDDIDRPRWGSVHDAAVARESEANEFASHLLVPERFATPNIRGRKPTLDVVRELADRFDTSLIAAAVAFIRLSNEPCALVFSKQGRVQWFSRTKDFEEMGLRISLGPVDPYTIAAEFFRRKPMQLLPGRVDARSWLEPGRFREDAMIKEHSVAMPNFDAVLSLLWVEDDI
jgi:Zn-dependent peptidase ImmA (M78 family)